MGYHAWGAGEREWWRSSALLITPPLVQAEAIHQLEGRGELAG